MPLFRPISFAWIAAISLAAASSAFGQASPSPSGAATPAPAQANGKVATVNGREIPKAYEDILVRQSMNQRGVPDSPQLRSAIREDLIKRELLVQDAEKQGYPQNPQVKDQVDYLRGQVLLNAYLQDYFQKHPISDAQIKAEYDKLEKSNSGKEYKASHILVKSETEAKDIITKLNKGAKFADLAKFSDDPGSKDRGGDLGWNSPSTFVKPFSDAMVKLKKGETTQQPVHTQFGYHVIRLEDVRAAKAPPMEQLRPRIQQELQQQQLEKLVADLRSKSTIQ